MLDWTGNIDNVFLVGGSMMILAGLLFFTLHLSYFDGVKSLDSITALERALPVFDADLIDVDVTVATDCGRTSSYQGDDDDVTGECLPSVTYSQDLVSDSVLTSRDDTVGGSRCVSIYPPDDTSELGSRSMAVGSKTSQINL